MKKFLLLSCALVIPSAAQASFTLKDISKSQTENSVQAPVPQAAVSAEIKTASLSRVKARPSLEVINDRYVPPELQNVQPAIQPVAPSAKSARRDESSQLPTVPSIPAAQSAMVPAPKHRTLQVISGVPPVAPPAAAPVMPPRTTKTIVARMSDDMPAPVVKTIVEPKPVESQPVPIIDSPRNLSGQQMEAELKQTVVSQDKPKSLLVEDKVVKSSKPAIPVPKERYETWRARKGELLKDVLKRWAERAGTDFVWTAAESPKVSKEFSMVGSFENAVSGLMKQDSGALKIKFADDAVAPGKSPDAPMGEAAGSPVMPEPVSNVPLPLEDGAKPIPLNMPPTETANKSLPVPAQEMMHDDMRMQAESDVMTAPEPLVSQASKSAYAAKGSSLESALSDWCEAAGVKLIWQTDQKYIVMKTVNSKESFENSVQTLLSQYDSHKKRPVGQLYKNPVTGEKVLVIKQDDA